MAMKLIALVMMATVASAAAGEHPIGKVIDMLKDLKAKAISEGQAEEVDFGKFKYWCSTSLSVLKKAIAKEKETIERLEDSIEGLKIEKKTLEKQIKELKDEITDLDKVAVAAKKSDADRTKAYTEKKADLESTIQSVGEAITALEEASKTDSGLLQKNAQNSIREAMAFLSMKATAAQRTVLVNFVSGDPKERPDLKVMGDDKSHVKKYNFKSDNVIDLIKELKLKFEDDLVAADTEETAGANQYALEKQARDSSKEAAEKSKTQKEKNLADTESSLTEAEGNLKSEQDDLKADEATLEATNSNCDTRNREWEERSKTRKGELEALTEGIKILSKESGVRTEKPNNPVLPSSPVSFLQVLRSQQVDPNTQAVNLLRTTAKTYHSKALERLALEVSTHLARTGDKKTEVLDMIQKMIFRLMAEQTDEDKHKAWCDLEIEKTDKSISDKKDKKEEISADITSQKANEAQLTIDIQEADKMVSEIDTFMGEATEVRTAGHEENTIAIKESKQAQTAIANAVAVLEDFYKSSGMVPKEPWEFLQKAPVELPEDPKLWSSPAYTGTDGATSIIAILETTATDFSKMEAETKAQEVEDQKEYDDTMKAHKVEKSRRQQESEAKVEEKKRKNAKIESLTKELKHTEDELEAVNKYQKDLQPTCVEGDSTYADRKAARTKEVDALKEAKEILRKGWGKSSFLAIKRHA